MLSSFKDNYLLEIEPQQTRSSRVLWLSFWAEVGGNGERDGCCDSAAPAPPFRIPAPSTLCLRGHPHQPTPTPSQVHYNSVVPEDSPEAQQQQQQKPPQGVETLLGSAQLHSLLFGRGLAGTGAGRAGNGGGVRIIPVE